MSRLTEKRRQRRRLRNPKRRLRKRLRALKRLALNIGDRDDD